MTNKETLTNYVKQIVGALKHAGIQDVVISPGSRSTPLAYAFATLEEFTVYRQIDERSAAFFALGLAKASGKPVVLLCTSGTAASNYYPAITEAHYARIPLIAITADRPHELREVGAPQAINQINMYGAHVKWSVDFPLAEKNEAVDTFIERHIQRGVSTAMTAPRGPVHFNVPFREPLLIDLALTLPEPTVTAQMTAKTELNEEMTETLEQLFNQSEAGIIVAGELPVHFDTQAFWRFAEALNWPVLCDPLSQLRTEVPLACIELCIDQYDALLKSEQFQKEVAPHTVVRIGAQPVSKPLALYLQKHRPKNYIVLDEDPIFRDSLGVVTHHIQAPEEVIMNLSVTNEKSHVTEKWIEANNLFTTLIQKFVGVRQDEGAYTSSLFDELPSDVDLISGSSMPIRDTDTFFRKTAKSIKIFANRGTNGIDGVVSTALGIQAHRQRPAYLLIGDLSFLHDVNGLIATRFHETDLTIVIMNNDGGGIFSYLPQATIERHYEDLFGTPTGLTFEHIAAMYDAEYHAVTTLDNFKEVLNDKKEKPLRILEVFTNRQENVRAHRALWKKMIERLEEND